MPRLTPRTFSPSTPRPPRLSHSVWRRTRAITRCRLPAISFITLAPGRSQWITKSMRARSACAWPQWPVLTVLPLSQRLHPVSDGLSDLIRRVLLQEVKPAHGDLCLRRPAPAGLPLGPGQNEPRLTVHEQLGNGTVREPLGVGAHDLDHVGGFPIERDLTRPGECGTAPLARLGKWAAVVRHLPLGQATQDGAGQDLLNEEVLLEDHRFSGLRAQGLENRADGLGHLVPREWPHEGLHVCKTLHRVAVAVSPVEAEG